MVLPHLGSKDLSLAKMINSAQQSAQRMWGSLRDLGAFSSLRVYTATKHCPRPPTRRYPQRAGISRWATSCIEKFMPNIDNHIGQFFTWISARSTHWSQHFRPRRSATKSRGSNVWPTEVPVGLDDTFLFHGLCTLVYTRDWCFLDVFWTPRICAMPFRRRMGYHLRIWRLVLVAPCLADVEWCSYK